MWCVINFWYQIALPPGTGPSSMAATSFQSLACEASTSVRMG